MTDKPRTYLMDVQSPLPSLSPSSLSAGQRRFVDVMTKVTVSTSLIYFSIHELIDELRQLRELREHSENRNRA